MSDVAARLRGTKQIADVGVSVDGAWQKNTWSSDSYFY